MPAMSPRAILALALLLASAGGALPAPPAAPSSGRAELDGLRSALERAMGKAVGVGMLAVSQAPGHAYHLKGYGAVIVLSPRPLPARRVVRRVVRGDRARGREVARALAEAQRDFAQGLAELQQQGLAEVEGPLLDLGDLEREMELQMAAQAEAMRRLEVEQQEWTRPREEVLRRQMRMIEEQAEMFRRAAERARMEAERSVRERLPPLPPYVVAVPETHEMPPLPPVPPAPPLPAVTAVPATPPSAPVAVSAPRPPAPPEPPDAPPPPWRFWFDVSSEDEEPEAPAPAPASVIAAARDALAAGLASYARPLASLGPDEFVSVAVDFVPERVPRARASRTLMARVRVRDLTDHQAGRLSAAALRQRIEFEEE
jgi:hypothetical protein